MTLSEADMKAARELMDQALDARTFKAADTMVAMAQVHAILAVAAAISEVRIQVQGDPDDPRY